LRTVKVNDLSTETKSDNDFFFLYGLPDKPLLFDEPGELGFFVDIYGGPPTITSQIYRLLNKKRNKFLL